MDRAAADGQDGAASEFVGLHPAASKPVHGFSKPVVDAVQLFAGYGIDGDAHAGITVQHRSRVAQDPTQPNLRQIHLIHAELLAGLVGRGFRVAPGVMGENLTTRGIDLLALPRGTRLRIGEATIEVTGLRNPCLQLNACQPGLMDAVLDRGADGVLIRKAGIMGIVLAGGEIRAGDGRIAGSSASIISLSLWVNKHTSLVIRREEEIEPLIEINRMIMQGLAGGRSLNVRRPQATAALSRLRDVPGSNCRA
eukprot:gene11648-15558_t